MDYFSTIIGQKKPVGFLTTCIMQKSLSHAYLFQGPSGVGKGMTARAFAGTVLAQEDEQAAVLLQQGVHPDLLILERAEGKTRLGKDQISKEMQPWLALKPHRSQHRFVIIKDAHLMSPEAENALLKTLEDPPLHAVIILLADEDVLLETILSRCQAVRFGPLPHEEILSCLHNQGFEGFQAEQAAKLAQGSMAMALQFAGEDQLNQYWHSAQDIAKRLITGGMADVFAAGEMIEKSPDLISHMLSTILRDIYVYATIGDTGYLVLSETKSISIEIKSAKPQSILNAWGEVQDLQRLSRRNINTLLLGINIAYAVKGAFF